jgi:hypothetical protein
MLRCPLRSAPQVVGYMRLPADALLERLSKASGAEEDMLFRVAVHRADAKVAAALRESYQIGYFDMRVQNVKDVVLSKLPTWFTGAAWSRRR